MIREDGERVALNEDRVCDENKREALGDDLFFLHLQHLEHSLILGRCSI